MSVLNIIDDPTDSKKSYLVMPLLRAADNPPFERVKEVVEFEFVDQMLEVCYCLIAEFERGLQIAGAHISARERGSSPVTNNRTYPVFRSLPFFLGIASGRTL